MKSLAKHQLSALRILKSKLTKHGDAYLTEMLQVDKQLEYTKRILLRRAEKLREEAKRIELLF